jgi:hypothetical protein
VCRPDLQAREAEAGVGGHAESRFEEVEQHLGPALVEQAVDERVL